MRLKRTDQQIEAVMNATIEADENGSKWPGMSYENGVKAALDWVVGLADDNPMELDDDGSPS